MDLNSVKQHGARYNANTMRDSITLYLRSRNCYEAIREFFVLPHRNTIKSFFGKLGSPGSIDECSKVIANVFSSLREVEKNCKILVDEIHIKPGAHFQGGHILGYAEDDSSKLAKTCLALMISPLMGKPAFVARLIPVYSLKADFLFTQVTTLLDLVHRNSGVVYMVMNDNLKTNQKMFTLFHQNYDCKDIFAVSHPVQNPSFQELFLLYDTTHLLKNIRNNWCTEKQQRLKFTDPETEEICIASWKDIILLYKNESMNIVKQTELNFSSLYPNNFEKQKVSLVLKVFNEKTVAALKLEKKNHTARFIELILRMWNILNIRWKSVRHQKNNPDLVEFSSTADERFAFLSKMSKMFENMHPLSGNSNARILTLTADTDKALNVTLEGMCALLPKLLSLDGMKYVLTGDLQSDRIEAEFGIYRQQSGGNYNISVQQVLNSLGVQRLKLYRKLEFEHSDNHVEKSCCKESLNSEEITCLDSCFDASSAITDLERSSLFHISGYIAFKEPSESTKQTFESTGLPRNSEFTVLVSRGKLLYPTEILFDLSLYLYSYYKHVNNKKCTNKIMLAFEKIYSYTGYDILNHRPVLRRFINCFSKALASMVTDECKREKKASERAVRDVKRRRICDGKM